MKDTDVRHIASLARLHLDDAEAAEMLKDLRKILHYIRTLDRLDTDEVEPMAHGHGAEGAGTRPDVVTDSMSAEDALAGAPDKCRGHFRVPKVL